MVAPVPTSASTSCSRWVSGCSRCALAGPGEQCPHPGADRQLVVEKYHGDHRLGSGARSTVDPRFKR
ncbi:MAG TPA: hypothetical protein VES60_16465 [Nakamurella sp.]|nr:hypothetical protein [Nakamurella sp.]